MSVILHRCPTCGHDDMSHHDTQKECSIGYCRCKSARGDVVLASDPELSPTFDVTTGETLVTIAEPGVLWGGVNRVGGRNTCACSACVDLYAANGGAA